MDNSGLLGLPDSALWNITFFLFSREHVRFASTCRSLNRWMPNSDSFESKRLCFCHRGWCDPFSDKCVHCKKTPVIPTRNRKNMIYLTKREMEILAIGKHILFTSDDPPRLDTYGNILIGDNFTPPSFSSPLFELKKAQVLIDYITEWLPFLNFSRKEEGQENTSMKSNIRMFWEKRYEIEESVCRFKHLHPSSYWEYPVSSELFAKTRSCHYLYRPIRMLERMIESYPSITDMSLFLARIRLEMQDFLQSNNNIYISVSFIPSNI